MLPPGMELITQEEAEEMARTTKRGTCELCGASANVGMNHGAKVCPQCTHVQSALNKRIESVAAAARSMGKTEELLGHLIPAGGGIAVKVTADLLQEISGLVGYEGEDPGELVEAVRSKVLTCYSCDADDVLQRIADVIGYDGARGDGLVEAVRALIVTPGTSPDCADCTALRGDLLRACGLEMDDTEDGEGWDVAAAAAIQTIAHMEIRRDFWASKATRFKVDAGDLRSELLVKRGEIEELRVEIARLNGHTHSESAEMTALRQDFERALQEIETASAKLTLAEQSRDEWEQLAVEAKDNVESLEAELRNREDAPAAPCASTTYLLDIALKAMRGEGPDADQLAVLIDAARRAA